MARKTKPAPKASKKTSQKPRPAATAHSGDDPLVVFAIRLPRSERELIHKAAGPRGATQFVRTVAVAAARGDNAAVRAAIEAAQSADA